MNRLLLVNNEAIIRCVALLVFVVEGGRGAFGANLPGENQTEG
jgi:hypothetical protein